MDESDKNPNQEESKKEETTHEEEAPAAAGDGDSPDLLKTELESLENVVVEELNSDKTKEAIDKTKTAVASLAQGFAQSARGLASKVETWSSVLNKQKPNGSEEPGSLPTSDKHVGESSAADAADTDNTNNHQQPPTTTDKQPLGVTSWINCCGLLEVLARPSEK